MRPGRREKTRAVRRPRERRGRHRSRPAFLCRAVCLAGLRRCRVVVPVSYTHLDVYKRQPKGRGDMPKSGRSAIMPLYFDRPAVGVAKTARVGPIDPTDRAAPCLDFGCPRKTQQPNTICTCSNVPTGPGTRATPSTWRGASPPTTPVAAPSTRGPVGRCVLWPRRPSTPSTRP